MFIAFTDANPDLHTIFITQANHMCETTLKFVMNYEME